MASQNESANNLFIILFEYIYMLKQQIAELSSQNASKDEIIQLKEAEALEAKNMYETYLNQDIEEDGILGEIIAKYQSELENLKAA
jgi:glycerol-3-phosphate responsive antiterminator